MSSILKALKKLEHEKSGHLPVSLKIDSDILRTVDSSRNISTSTFVIMIFLVFAGGAAVAFYFMKETKVGPSITAPQSTITPQLSLPSPIIKPEILPAEIVMVPARKLTSGEVSRQLNNKPDSGEPSERVSGTSDKEPQINYFLSQKKAPGTLPVERSAHTIPALRVNGIAFQVSGADNMAIINGTAVASGSTIEGVTVEEVQKDRVLFQFNGEKFEIQLGQSNK